MSASPATASPVPQGLGATEGPLAAAHDLLILDLDGVVYVGPRAVPGAAEALGAVRGGDTGSPVPCCYLTNNASRTPGTVAGHLNELGIHATEDEILTSAQVAAALLAARLPADSRILLVGGDGLREALLEEGLAPVASMDEDPVAVVQGFNPEICWAHLAGGAHAVRAGLFWVASNLDLTVPTEHGPAPGNGSLVAAVAAAGGRDPDLVAGKPQPEPFLEAARRNASTRPLVVGDRLDTDLEGGRAAGMPGLAVLTGVSTASDLVLAAPHTRPRYLSLDLSGLLQSHPQVDVRDGQATCRGATVRLEDGRLRVVEAGGEPVDLLRAACGSAWASEGLERAGLQELLQTLSGFDSARRWAR